MLTPTDKKSFNNRIITTFNEKFPNVLTNDGKKRSNKRNYSLLTVTENQGNGYSAVVQNGQTDMLRISLCNMAVYECYLFAFGLPYNFPKEQIIIYGDNRSNYIPNEVNFRHRRSQKKIRYNYELTVSAETEKGEYRKRILQDLNLFFQLEAKVEKLVVVKEGQKNVTPSGYSLKLIWEDQLIMVLKTKGWLTMQKSLYKRSQ